MDSQNEVVAAAPRQLAAVPAAVTPADLMRYALDSGADLDRLEKLMDLQVKYEADQARKAFADDMARFKAKSITISKDKQVRFKTDKGITEYMHATIGNVVEVIVPALAEFGFSHRWSLEQRDGLVIVTCVITHRLGHHQTTTLMANPDQSGGKNAIQSVISAKTYLERHTLLAATGLATKDQPDDDSNATGAERGEMQQEAASMRKDSKRRASPADVAAQRQQPAAPTGDALADARTAASLGHDEFGKHWRGLDDATRRSLAASMAELTALADGAK